MIHGVKVKKNKKERHWELERHTHPLAFENLTVRPQCKLSTRLTKISQTPNGQIFFIQHLGGNQSLCLNKKKLLSLKMITH